jgi:hypothetical protein
LQSRSNIANIAALLLLLAGGCLLGAQAPAAAPSTSPADSRVLPAPAKHAFPDGQTLDYIAEWRLFNAGVAQFRMERAGREQRVVATADATGFVSLLYHVHDRFESFFDPVTFCSRTVSKHTEEGFRRLDTEITFDGQRKKAVLHEKNLKDNRIKQAENDMPACVSDVVSSIYYVGALPLTANTTYYFPVNDGGKTIDVKAIVETHEEVKVPTGTYKTVRVQITSDSTSVKNRGQIWIWYTDDANRTPVQMKSRLFWGTLSFRLQKISSATAKP